MQHDNAGSCPQRKPTAVLDIERYYVAGFGLPLSMLITDEVRAWYCDRMAAEFALIKCMNEFIRDYNQGLFKPKTEQLQ